jgi:hypothetical protein
MLGWYILVRNRTLGCRALSLGQSGTKIRTTPPAQPHCGRVWELTRRSVCFVQRQSRKGSLLAATAEAEEQPFYTADLVWLEHGACMHTTGMRP